MQRAIAAAPLLLLAACLSLPNDVIEASVEDRVQLEGVAGDRVQLLNEGPGDLVFDLVRGKGPAQQVKIAQGMAWDFPGEGLRSIVVTHKAEGAGRVRVTVIGPSGGGIRVRDLPPQ